MKSFDDFLQEEINRFKLTAPERLQLRDVVKSRCAIIGKAAKVGIIFEQAAAATIFIETLQDRVYAAATKKFDRASNKTRHRHG